MGRQPPRTPVEDPMKKWIKDRVLHAQKLQKTLKRPRSASDAGKKSSEEEMGAVGCDTRLRRIVSQPCAGRYPGRNYDSVLAVFFWPRQALTIEIGGCFGGWKVSFPLGSLSFRPPILCSVF